ncbi:TPA: hypothetical protein N0F65_003797 [Lagenidium giganteum]|uniref:hydroxyacylglutathione hydrolase n=1 Tax=Lagenidium giganteum TaxID=4803 RepID=A0AAV2YYS9_9STRA|nr:TPA: hypothetical protein N0F65_003797 [Lagenidium giganteum]
MEVVHVPVLSDNYAYLLIDRNQRIAAAIDPVEPEKVVAAAKAQNVQIRMILTTHSHWDHAGGNEALRDLIKAHEGVDIPVIGGNDDNVPAVTREVGHDEHIQLGSLDIRVLHTPCHTRGHVLYLCDDVLFTGDTLFIAGCGRFFAGTPAEMHHALNEVVAPLRLKTKIYCGHEYTYSNLRFAAHVEPENEAVQKKLAWAKAQQEANLPTIPSTIGDELETNPFMRVNKPAVQKFTGAHDSVDVMRELRAAKDQFGIGKGKI